MCLKLNHHKSYLTILQTLSARNPSKDPVIIQEEAHEELATKLRLKDIDKKGRYMQKNFKRVSKVYKHKSRVAMIS